MRVATTFAGVPNPFQAGGPLMHFASIKALLDADHDVTFVSLPWEEPPRDDRIAALRELGAAVVVVPASSGASPTTSRWAARLAYARTLLWPRDEVLFPSLASAEGLERAIAEIRPDALVADGVGAVAAAHRVAVPKLAFIGDPPGFSRKVRAQWDPLYPQRLSRNALLYRLGIASFALRADRRILDLLRRYDSVGIFGAHRAEWARDHGVNAWYVRSPIVDGAGSRWRERRAAMPPNPRPRILMIGHLRGIATISALHVFVRDMLPELTRELGEDGFEVHIAGAYDPPASLAAALDHPAIVLRGHVEPPDEEFFRADVVLVPTPIETGPRVRILTAFSYGCCVVAHRANELGIPQLAHGENVLLGDEKTLAHETLRALRDGELRARLGEAGRRVYETEFTPEIAGGRIVAELERIAGRDGPRTP